MLIALLLAAITPATGPDPALLRAVERDVALLASPTLRGREAGSAEAAFVAHWLRRRFEKLGLAPVAGGASGDGAGMWQTVPLTRISADLAQATLSIRSGANVQTVRSGDSMLVDLSGEPPSSNAAHALVFAGYGIQSPAQNHDELAALDLAGKAVLVWAGEPKNPDGSSPFTKGRMSRFALSSTKRMLAAQAGAALLLIGTPPGGGAAALESARRAARERARPKLVLREAGPQPPIVYLNEAQTTALVAAAGLDAGALLADCGVGRRASRVLDGVSVALELPALHQEPVDERNVLGLLRGKTTPQEVVVLSAHYDHLGAERNAAGELVIYPGADDNASGVAALLAAAAHLAKGVRPARSVLFAGFAAEESGALGSTWFERHRLPEGSTIVAVVNLDMVGQNHLAKPEYRHVVMASYTARAAALTELLVKVGARSGIDVRKIPYLRPSGRSDDTAFAEHKTPALLLFTGMHPDHDTPNDTAARLITPKVAEIGLFAAELVRGLTQHGPLAWDETLSEAPASDPWDRPY